MRVAVEQNRSEQLAKETNVFDTINGIPLHPLVVHAVVVLLPLSVIGTICIALRPSWRQPYGGLVLAAAVIATVLCPVATSSGEAFEKRVGDPGAHAALGDQLVWFALVLAIAIAALLWVNRQQADADRSTRKGLLRAVVVVAVLAALATSVQVYRVGDSGARAAWGQAGQS